MAGVRLNFKEINFYYKFYKFLFSKVLAEVQRPLRMELSLNAPTRLAITCLQAECEEEGAVKDVHKTYKIYETFFPF